MSFVASWNDYRPLDSLVILFDASIVTRLFAMAMKKRLDKSIQVIPVTNNDAGGAVLNKSEMMINIRDGSITKAEDQ